MNTIRCLIARYHFPHILLLGLLAFGILIKPILFSMGEMHELQHDSKAVVSHLDLGASHEKNVLNPSPDGQTSTHVLHALTNFAHNCDQPTFTETGYFASLDAVLSHANIPTLRDFLSKSIRVSSLHRPPIL